MFPGTTGLFHIISVHSLAPYWFKTHFNITFYAPPYLPNVLLRHLNIIHFSFLLAVRFGILCIYTPVRTLPCHVTPVLTDGLLEHYVLPKQFIPAHVPITFPSLERIKHLPLSHCVPFCFH